MIFRIEFYPWTKHAAVRDLVAAVVRRCRRDRRTGTITPLTPAEHKAYQLWVAGGFHRDALAAGWLIDQNWSVVRHGDGRWWAFDPQRRMLHRLHITKNLSANVSYQHTA